MKYHKLNSTFEYGGTILRVIKHDIGCKGCYFYDKMRGCTSTSYVIKSCTPIHRKDKNNVIYQEVKKEVTNINKNNMKRIAKAIAVAFLNLSLVAFITVGLLLRYAHFFNCEGIWQIKEYLIGIVVVLALAAILSCSYYFLIVERLGDK